VAKYSLEIKQSAQRELDALDDALFTRIDRKILALADSPRPAGCKKLAKGSTLEIPKPQ
jgi:mRNA-degrading endonuclease RelE of RelBE toxin-antitoxin system